MAKHNSVFLRGTVVKNVFFGQVARRRLEASATDNGAAEEKVAFLRFFLRAPRDRTQPSIFQFDDVRVAVYGREAERAYPRLARGVPVIVLGWLQHRVHKRRSILEVIGDEVQVLPTELELAEGDLMLGLQGLADRWDIEVSRVLELLLTPQLREAQRGALTLEELQAEKELGDDQADPHD